jgi:hypothetical protein
MKNLTPRLRHSKKPESGEEFGKQHVEMVNSIFTFDGIAAAVVGG